MERHSGAYWAHDDMGLGRHHPADEHERIRRNEMSDKTDAEEFKEIMQTISETVPDLIDKVNKIMYGPEGSNYAKAVAEFYKTLIEAGMDEDKAYKLTQEYMSNMSLGGMIGNMGKAAGHGHHGED